MYDLIIKGGRVVDGTGRTAFNADVAVKDGAIAAIGPLGSDARQVVDAKGHVVAPGFIDPHTHFDVQCCGTARPSPPWSTAITSIVPGNCSLSLAPLKAADRKAVVGMFQQIEEMPPEAFTEAFEWTWEDFAGYLDAIEAPSRHQCRAPGGPQRHPPVGDGRRLAGTRREPRRDRRDAGPAARVPGGRCGRFDHQLRRRGREARPVPSRFADG